MKLRSRVTRRQFDSRWWIWSDRLHWSIVTVGLRLETNDLNELKMSQPIFSLQLFLGCHQESISSLIILAKGKRSNHFLQSNTDNKDHKKPNKLTMEMWLLKPVKLPDVRISKNNSIDVDFAVSLAMSYCTFLTVKTINSEKNRQLEQLQHHLHTGTIRQLH